MKRYVVAVASACLLALTACTTNNSSSPEPTQPPTTTSEPALSPEEAKKLAAAEKARQLALQKEVKKRVAVVEKAMKAQALPTGKLNVIITAYCKINRDPDSVEKAEMSLLEELYGKYWQAGRWNKDLELASQQTGACPSSLPQDLPQT